MFKKVAVTPASPRAPRRALSRGAAAAFETGLAEAKVKAGISL